LINSMEALVDICADMNQKYGVFIK
jgi:hypothetical protein